MHGRFAVSSFVQAFDSQTSNMFTKEDIISGEIGREGLSSNRRLSVRLAHVSQNEILQLRRVVLTKYATFTTYFTASTL